MSKLTITRLLIALNVLIYVGMGLQSGTWMTFKGATEVLFGANYPPLVQNAHQWFRLFTSVFLHGGALHLGMNMLALKQVGEVLEPFYGRARFVAVYLAAGVIASLASMYLHARPTLSVGASGAIAGLIGAGVVAGQIVGTDQGRAFRDAMLRWAATIIAFGFLVPGIDNAAHAGGFVAGIAAAGALAAGLKRRAREGRLGESTTEALGATTALLLVVALGFGLAWAAARPLIDSGLADPPSSDG